MKSLRIIALASTLFGLLSISCSQAQKQKTQEKETVRQVQKTKEEWKNQLSAQSYYVLREKGTERAFTSPLNANKQKGVYKCAGCGTELFSSQHKFESGTGWPSFYKPLVAKNVDEKADHDAGMVRTEVLCNVCGGHLGHVFEDGPAPTGLRYCLNGAALTFEKKD
ncbi:peptide-methionine (R)-S-oxide reductase MsrB [Telluribacter sp.]|jgi:peptide-methionine (R)-S-oxide reductase|uniref:peptide-methionine (R)-S-oxide reductase MsrB n=1 Tax=Telluribacter sp. TaxID=1978767 RepID=UPI002E13C827|nr:peptide-methionine (R)-S-oxide reductase MsrB [Telluribacter sp.]